MSVNDFLSMKFDHFRVYGTVPSYDLWRRWDRKIEINPIMFLLHTFSLLSFLLFWCLSSFYFSQFIIFFLIFFVSYFSFLFYLDFFLPFYFSQFILFFTLFGVFSLFSFTMMPFFFVLNFLYFFTLFSCWHSFSFSSIVFQLKKAWWLLRYEFGIQIYFKNEPQSCEQIRK